MKNKTIKMMFTEKINKQQIYNNVLNYQKEKKKSVLIPLITASIIIIGAIFILNYQSDKSSNMKVMQNKSCIKINEVIEEPCPNCSTLKKENLYTAELSPSTEYANDNSNIDFSHEIEIPSEIKNLIIPEDLKLMSHFAIDLNDDEDNLEEKNTIQELIYQSTSTKRKIKIAYSKSNIVIEQYKIATITDASIINDTPLYIYNLDNSYRAIFTYKNIYYRVESENINEEEFITLLESMIKE